MKKENLVSLSSKMRKMFKEKSSTHIYTVLSQDKVFGDLPLNNKDKVLISFLMSNSSDNPDLSELYDKIERSLFVAEITHIDEKDSEGPCEDCGGTGEFDCDNCKGEGYVDCHECEGSGEVWDYDDEVPRLCYNCHGDETESCDLCDSSGTESCESCFGEGEVIVEDSATVSEWKLYSFNPRIFNLLEMVDEGLIKQEIFDEITSNDKDCILTWDGNHKFYEHQYDWTLKDDIVLESLQLI